MVSESRADGSMASRISTKSNNKQPVVILTFIDFKHITLLPGIMFLKAVIFRQSIC